MRGGGRPRGLATNDVYKNGKVAGHEGAWLSGVKGAKFGMMLPGQPKVRKFYQEQAPGVGMDRVEIKSATEKPLRSKRA